MQLLPTQSSNCCTRNRPLEGSRPPRCSGPTPAPRRAHQQKSPARGEARAGRDKYDPQVRDMELGQTLCMHRCTVQQTLHRTCSTSVNQEAGDRTCSRAPSGRYSSTATDWAP